MNASQHILEGLDALPAAAQALQRILLVADASFPYLNIRDQVLRAVHPVALFDAFHSNPVDEEVRAGDALFREHRCDALVAVGGGSAMDVAKCIKLLEIGRDSAACAIPLIAIPTTAGTGAESTGNAVYYLDGVKQTVAHPCIRPDYAFLEPSVLGTLPPYQKKCTLMDALCQAIESWWSVAATPESRGYSESAIRLIMPSWHAYLFHYTPAAARNIMLAANYAGRAIHIAHTTAAHAMSYKLGSLFGLSHGHAVAVCLPEIWEYMLVHADAPTQAVFADIAAAMCAPDYGAPFPEGIVSETVSASLRPRPPATPAGPSLLCGRGWPQVSDTIPSSNFAPSAALALFRAMMAEIGLEGPVAGEDREALLDTLAGAVNQTRLRNNPVALDYDTCKMLYDKIVR